MERRTRKDLLSPADPKARQKAFFQALDGLSGVHLAFNCLPDTRVVIKDSKGRFVWVSDNVPARHGFRSPDDFVGLHDRDINPRPLAEVYWRDDREVLRTGKPLLGKTEIAFNDAGLPDWYVVKKLPLYGREKQVCGLIAIISPHPGLHRIPLLSGGAKRAAEHIQNNLGGPLRLAELARVAGMSIRQLQRQFNGFTGLHPSEFIKRCRIAEACRLLRETDASIGSIALDLGFYDQSAFTKAFRRFIRIKPIDYRRARPEHRLGKPAEPGLRTDT